jgi:RHS repeat-associated protein
MNSPKEVPHVTLDFMIHITASFRRLPAALALGVFLWSAPLCLPSGLQDDQSLATQISTAHGFYRPLVQVGCNPATQAENQLLHSELEKIKKRGLAPSVPALEQFVSTYPNSPWTPCLCANLGRHYQERALYSKAIQQWETAWAATRNATNGPAKQLADFTLAHWTKLLASLGSADQLGSLLRETEHRTIGFGPWQQMLNSSRHAYTRMCNTTDVSFRCGAYALNSVIHALQGTAYDPSEIARVPAPVTGFSMSRLLEMAQRAGSDLIAAEWGGEKTLVVPCVVHWKQNHYATILAERNGTYKVLDPALNYRSRWLTLEDIQGEASGHFIVPRTKLPKHWRPLAKAETDEVFGRGIFNDVNDRVDGCGNGSGGAAPAGGLEGNGRGGVRVGTAPTDPASSWGTAASTSALWCPSCAQGGSAGGTGGGGAGCCAGSGGGGGLGGNSGGGGDWAGPVSTFAGMPVWEVSEPYINLWLYDEPLGYQPGLGSRISFKLAYKQREERPISQDFFSLGQNWNCSWLSYIEDAFATNGPIMIVPGGGEREYDLDPSSGISTTEYFSHTTLQRLINASNELTGFVVSYPNGAKDYYQYVLLNGPNNAKPTAFLTAQTDPFSHTNLFLYEETVYQETNSLLLLRHVVDADGRTNTLSYTNTSPYHAQITGVQDPFGRFIVLQYDSATGMLTNITDAAGLSSSFEYDIENQVTSLTTPYGTTTFEHPATFTDADVYRAIRVIDAVGGANIYMLRQNCTTEGSLWDYLAYTIPYLYTPAVPGGTFDTELQFRNSLHWGPRQAAGLPENLNSFGKAEGIKARLRHWLHPNPDFGGISQSLTLQIEPSPDGVNPGQTTCYNYAGMWTATNEGTNSLPSIVARRLVPDGPTWYTIYQRDVWGHPTNVVETYSTAFGGDPLTRTNHYLYDSNEVDLVQAIGPEGQTLWGLFYDNNHHVLRMTNAFEDVTSYTYDVAGCLTSVKTPAGLTTTNVYFPTGDYTNWVQTRIDLEIARTNSFTYSNDLIHTHTDERGLTTTNSWDNLQRLTSVSDPHGAVLYAYDKLDLVRTVDRMGLTNSFGYDAVRRLVAQTNALGHYTLYTNCSCGGLESVRDAGGNDTLFYYDNAGRRIQTVYTNIYTVNYGYNLLGQLTNVTDSAGSSVTNWYNNQGLLYAVSNAFGEVRGIVFDIEDRTTSRTDTDGVEIVTTYDDLGRPLTRTYPDEGVERFGYSPAGLIAYTNQVGKVTRYGYDAAGRKTAETNANQEVTQFTYNAAGDLLTLTDGKNQTTTWVYDQYGRVTNKLDTLDNLMFSYAYDENSRLTNRWTPAKGNTAYRYDALGNLTNIVYASSPAISLQYDVLNRVTNMVDAVGTTTYGYDAAGQVLSEDGPWANDTVSYTYNSRLRASVSVQAPNASPWTAGYGYDAAKRLTGITSPAGAFGYDYSVGQSVSPASLVRALTLPSGAYITNTYDNVARLLSTTLKSSSHATINSHSYQLNQGNQRTQQVFTAGNYVDYTYDDIGQLESARGRESGGATNRWHEQLGYAYDAAGNLNYRTNNALIQTFNVNDLNELTTASRSGALTVAGTTTSPATNVTVNAVNAILYTDSTFARTNVTLAEGTNIFSAIAHDNYGRSETNVSTSYLPSSISFTYDANGNLTGDGHRCFAYDDENQLISVWVTNTWRSDFAYDGKMRRRIRREYLWQSAIWNLQCEIRYVYDGNLVVQERDANNLPLVSYTRSRDLSGTLEGAGGIGGLLARTDHRPFAIGDSSAHAHYHADGNGNITCLISSNQIIVAHYLYDPYGNILSQSGPLADGNLYRFSGKEFHVASGLVYYLYRLYQPSLQRWLNRDPLWEPGFEAGHRGIGQAPINELWHHNLYTPFENAPLLNVDAFGLTRIGVGECIVTVACHILCAYLEVCPRPRIWFDDTDISKNRYDLTFCFLLWVLTGGKPFPDGYYWP